MKDKQWRRLAGVEPKFYPKLVTTVEDFHSTPNSRYVFGGVTKIELSQPTIISEEDAAFFQSGLNLNLNKSDKKLPAVAYGPKCRISKGVDKFICLARGGEGIIFDQNGLFKSGGFLDKIKSLPKWLARDETKPSAYYVDNEYLNSLPVQKGSFIVFFDGNVHNYKHWWIDMLCPLDAATRRCKVEGYRLLPSAIQNLHPWQQDSLRWLNHGNLFSPDAGADVIRVEEAIWVDIVDFFPFHYDQLAEVRRIATAPLGAGAPRKKIYIKRLNNLRAMRNESEVEGALASFGFEPAILELMDQREQSSLFAQAAVVIGNHGAGFANILFSAPGTLVLEFMPSVEMRAHYWGIATSLGQRYGFIRCNSAGRKNFHDPIEVNIHSLNRLLELSL